MIVRQKNTGWSIIFHTSHGLLAQQIAARLNVASDLPYWFETQVQIGLHDDLHCVYEIGKREHLTDAGAPCDFTLVPMKEGSRVQEMQDRIDEAYRKHTWMGIMQSKHAECLYSGEDVTADMKRLLKVEAKRRSAAMANLSIEPTTVQSTYDWMQFCDRFSLILCGDDVPAMNRRLEIITDSAGTRFDVWQDEDDRIRADPWPFDTDQVELRVEYRILKQLSFVDDVELNEALKAAPVECRTVAIFEH